MDNPKVLVFDIETFPLEVRIWQLGDQRVTLDQIIKDWSVASWAAKWLKDPPSQVMYRDTRNNKDVRQDRNILVPMWKLLDEADIVVTQNGQKFDSRKLNARFITHGMKPPSPYTHLDTYKIADKVAEFTSHKLEYLTEKLNVRYKKLKHKKFPGRSLWDGCLAGKTAAWDEIKRYNIHDVLSTEELYLNLQAWAPMNAPKPYSGAECETCGPAGRVQKAGMYRKKSGLFQRLHCVQCGVWTIGAKIKKDGTK